MTMSKIKGLLFDILFFMLYRTDAALVFSWWDASRNKQNSNQRDERSGTEIFARRSTAASIRFLSVVFLINFLSGTLMHPSNNAMVNALIVSEIVGLGSILMQLARWYSGSNSSWLSIGSLSSFIARRRYQLPHLLAENYWTVVGLSLIGFSSGAFCRIFPQNVRKTLVIQSYSEQFDR